MGFKLGKAIKINNKKHFKIMILYNGCVLQAWRIVSGEIEAMWENYYTLNIRHFIHEWKSWTEAGDWA